MSCLKREVVIRWMDCITYRIGIVGKIEGKKSNAKYGPTIA
jgi:hypothetical protein